MGPATYKYIILLCPVAHQQRRISNNPFLSMINNYAMYRYLQRPSDPFLQHSSLSSPIASFVRRHIVHGLLASSPVLNFLHQQHPKCNNVEILATQRPASPPVMSIGDLSMSPTEPIPAMHPPWRHQLLQTTAAFRHVPANGVCAKPEQRSRGGTVVS